MTKLKLTLSIFSFLVIQTGTSLACGIDVSITEGDTVRMCPDAITNVNASAGYVSYNWYGVSTGTGQSFTPTGAGWYFVDATDGVACVSTDSVFVIIYTTTPPVIQSSEGTNICPSVGGTNLSLTATYSSYLWSTGETSPSISTSTSGNYSVAVEDANGCVSNGSMMIDFIDFNITPSQTQPVCHDIYVGLQANGGGTYLWSTGETSDLIVVSPFETTTYTVTITNGTCQASVSHTVEVYELPLYDWKDTVYYGVNDNMALEAPSNYSNYLWTPTLSVNDTSNQSVSYVGSESGSVYIWMLSADGCVAVDTVFIQIVDLSIPEGFSPNVDEVNDFFVVPELANMKGKITIWNRWGEMVFKADHYKNNWDGKCKTALCVGNDDLPEGTYFYAIDVHDVKFDGYIILKR